MAYKDDHYLLDLLWRNRRGELQMSVVMVIANHPDLAEHVRPFGVPSSTFPRPATPAPKPNSVSFNCSAAM
jgi:formyltetrahydrofolate deformylase